MRLQSVFFTIYAHSDNGKKFIQSHLWARFTNSAQTSSADEIVLSGFTKDAVKN